MSQIIDERSTDLTPEQEAARIAERKAKEARDKQAARLRFIGAILVGALGVFKLTLGGAEGMSEALWTGAIFVAFGLASVEQVAKALGRS